MTKISPAMICRTASYEHDALPAAEDGQIRALLTFTSEPRHPCVIDLFAGVGGLSLGAARAGFNLSLAVELDEHAMAAHRRNFPNCKHLQKDISKLTGEDLLREAELEPGELDGLVGGPPCQGFSEMGDRSEDDPRNDLFVKFFDLAAQCRPKFFVAENVPGVLEPEYETVRETALGHVQEHYVLLDPLLLNACDFGAPTVRERVFFIGYLPEDLGPIEPADFFATQIPSPTVAEALHGLPRAVRCDWLTEEQSWRPVALSPDHVARNAYYWERTHRAVPDGVGDSVALKRHRETGSVSGNFGVRHTRAVAARYARLRPGQKDEVSKSVRLRSDGYCPTLRAGTGSDRGRYQAVRPIHPTAPRVITPREAARLQGFPDWFQFAPSKWHSFRQIGNSVSPFVAEGVMRTLLAKLYGHPSH